jgi:hypothetical protein
MSQRSYAGLRFPRSLCRVAGLQPPQIRTAKPVGQHESSMQVIAAR